MTTNRSPSPEQRPPMELARDTAMHAQAYVRAAERIASTSVGSPSDIIDMRMPMNFLLGHACELAMKSLLIAKGYDDAKLKAISHHLDKGVSACAAEGITLAQEFVKYCEIMGPAHEGYLTRYAIRSFPWVGYDDAIRMISPQMEQLPWVWPKPNGTGIDGFPIGREISRPTIDARVSRAMSKSAERVLADLQNAATRLYASMSLIGRENGDSHLRELADLCVAHFEEIGVAVTDTLEELVPTENAGLYRGAFVNVIDDAAPSVVVAFKAGGGDQPSRDTTSPAEEADLRERLEESRRDMVDRFDLKYGTTSATPIPPTEVS